MRIKLRNITGMNSVKIRRSVFIESISLIGVESINERLTTTYTVQVHYSDGSVVPWSSKIGALTFSLVSGGGTINSTNGVYTAPSVTANSLSRIQATLISSRTTYTSKIKSLTILQIDPPRITSVTIVGPSEVKFPGGDWFYGTVTFENGTTRRIVQSDNPSWTFSNPDLLRIADMNNGSVKLSVGVVRLNSSAHIYLSVNIDGVQSGRVSKSLLVLK